MADQQPVKWRCAHNCGRLVTDEFYQRIVRDAGHPPVCECRHSPSGWMNAPWSLWEMAKESNHG